MGQHAWPATGHSPVPLGSSCPWPYVGMVHTPGRGWVSPGCWCSPGVLTEQGMLRPHQPDSSASWVWLEHPLPAASPSPHPASTKQMKREEVTWGKAIENQNQRLECGEWEGRVESHQRSCRSLLPTVGWTQGRNLSLFSCKSIQQLTPG